MLGGRNDVLPSRNFFAQFKGYTPCIFQYFRKIVLYVATWLLIMFDYAFNNVTSLIPRRGGGKPPPTVVVQNCCFCSEFHISGLIQWHVSSIESRL
jgi:hypothetical protein